MPEYKLLEYEVDGTAAVLTMDNLENQNALSAQLLADLSEGLCEAERDDDVRVVVLTGKERIFCAGANINEFKFDASGAASGRILSDEDFREPFDLIEHLDKLVIAAVNGTALGGGFELALVSDLVVVGEDITMGLFNEAVATGAVRDRVNEYVDQISGVAPVALIVIKKIANRHRGSDDNLIADFGMSLLFETDDIREGTEAFLEKYEPDFKGH